MAWAPHGLSKRTQVFVRVLAGGLVPPANHLQRRHHEILGAALTTGDDPVSLVAFRLAREGRVTLFAAVFHVALSVSDRHKTVK